MFSGRITNSARFLTMPPSCQNLYFHLGMHADDDGVVEAHTILKITDSKAGDFTTLVDKKFIYPLNDDLVVVILDWREHNLIRADRKIDSIYREILEDKVPGLRLIEPKIRADLSGRPVDNQMSAQVRLGKDRKGKVRIGKERLDNTAEHSSAEVVEVIDSFKEVNPSYNKWFGNKTQRAACERMIKVSGKETLLKVVKLLPKSNSKDYFPVITTPLQLEDKFAQLATAWQKYKNNQPIIL